MEETSSITCISIFRDKKKALDDHQNGMPIQKERTRFPSMSLFKVALSMLRTKPAAESEVSNSKPVQVDEDFKVEWKGIVGSMRPMHLQSTQLSPSPSPRIKAKPEVMLEPQSIPGEEQTEEAITSSLSPMAFSISSFGAVPMSDVSRYGSLCEEITKEKCGNDDDGGDEK